MKPQTLSKFKVGATKDGKILACQREFHVNTGANPGGGVGGEGGGGRSELYLHVVPNWKEIGFLYRTNSMLTGPSRSNYQQEFKWAWEQMMDEMAEAVGMDPMKFRLLNIQKPGTKIAIGQGGPTIVPMPETENGFLTYDCYAVVEILEEGVEGRLDGTSGIQCQAETPEDSSAGSDWRCPSTTPAAWATRKASLASIGSCPGSRRRRR